jgi:hypothetical protein
MTIRETEYIKSPAHHGNGLTFCNEGCHKDGTILLNVTNGYDSDQITLQQAALLRAAALIHDQEHPKHDIRVIIMGTK